MLPPLFLFVNILTPENTLKDNRRTLTKWCKPVTIKMSLDKA